MTEDCFPLPRNENKNFLQPDECHGAFVFILLYSFVTVIRIVKGCLVYRKTQLTNKDSPEIAVCVNMVTGAIITFHFFEVVNVMQLDPKVIHVSFEDGIPV